MWRVGVLSSTRRRMLKPLIWGSQPPEWEDEGGPPASQQTSQTSGAASASAAATAAAAAGFKQDPYSQDHHRPTAAAAAAAARPRGNYDPARGSALLGPLSVNDPQLEPQDKGDRFILSESSLTIASPFGPVGAGNDWRVLRKDAPEHVHRLLRALAAAQDYAGAARALATLHRLHSAFDPDVYRFTVALLRLSGNHQKTSMYFRKILGKKARSITKDRLLQGRAIAHDFLAYLADRQKFGEALNVSQNFLHGGSLSNNGAFKRDPSLKAHAAVLQLFAALLEHQAGGRDTPSGVSGTTTTSTIGSTGAGAVGAAGAAGATGRGGRRRQHFSPSPRRRVPGLQDPLSLVGHVRACGGECTSSSATAQAQAGSPQGRAREHLRHAKRLLGQAAADLPGDASVAGYLAAVTAAEGGGGGTVTALRQLERFVERNPGSVKGRALHARLLEMSSREAQRAAVATASAANSGGGGGYREESGRRSRRRLEGGGGGDGRGGRREEKGDGEGDDDDDDDDDNNDDDNRLLLVEVARARALRGWLETDPFEPRASLGLASLHSGGPGAVVGVADRAFVVGGLVRQLETSCGAPRSCPSASRGVLYTTRAATALWAALADLLGPLRVRDEPVPVVRRGRGGGGLKRPRSMTAPATPPLPPRPGTMWDHLYGADPPWAPTDFAHQGRGGGFSEEAEGAERRAGSELPQLESSPHPLLRGVDRDLWGETVLDPGGEPLLLAKTRAAWRGGGATAEEGDTDAWCSDDEDCVSGDDESELLQERARLASRRSGGCLYYSPPGGEEGFRTRATWGEDARRPFFGATTAGIVLEGVVEVREGGGGCDEDGRGESAAVAAATPVHAGAGAGAASGGAAGGRGSSGGGSSRRRDERMDVDSEDNADAYGEVEVIGVVANKAKKSRVVDPDGGGGGGDGDGHNSADEWEDGDSSGGGGDDDDEDDDDGEDGEGAPALREPEGVLCRPAGTDAAAARLSETVSVELPQKAAAWLLADKCLVAAHMFGPQHPYCLRAIGRLCREDVRGAARPARASLRSRGFRLQLSLARLAADNARSRAAREGRKPSVAWGLPDPPPAAQNSVPFDSYVPELI